MRHPRPLLIAAVLAVLTALPYLQVAAFEFVSWDDPVYVQRNLHVRQGLSAESIRWAATAIHAGNWHPLTTLSHLADVSLFGLEPGAHHLVNLAFHVANTALLFLVLFAMTGATWRCALVAALFGLHPLHVESVAWISERKDLLSTFFGLLSIACYVGYARTGSELRYWASFSLLALGLMAKPMLVTWPALLLLLDLWPLRRWGGADPVAHANGARAGQIGIRAALREKLPLLGLSAGFAVITLRTQALAGATDPGAGIALLARIENAVASTAWYLVKTLWPRDLAFLYMHGALPGGVPFSGPAVIGAGLLLIAITVASLAVSRRYLLVGWLWFLVTLAPVAGLIQAGAQGRADRYTYVPLIGVFLAAVWGAADATASWRRATRLRGTLVTAVLLALVVLCGVGTWHQARTWKTSETLYKHAIEVGHASPIAHGSLGNWLRNRGRVDEAIHHYEAALALAPSPKAQGRIHRDWAEALLLQGQVRAAERHLRESVRVRPDWALGRETLSRVLRKQRRFGEAVVHARSAVEAQPDRFAAQFALGASLLGAGRPAEAIPALERALELSPGSELVLPHLAKAREQVDGDGPMPDAQDAVERR